MTRQICPVCDGAGEVTVNDTDPHGYGPDPQCDEPALCPNENCVDGWEVPRRRWHETVEKAA